MRQIKISIKEQTLTLYKDSSPIAVYPISSASNGIGSEEGSYKTPKGLFKVDEKHGYNSPLNTIFKSRKPQGIWSTDSSEEGDLVLSRILWLAGTEDHNSNTKQRYIYIHGTNHEELIGSPHSCGCIRMKNTDVIELYQQTSIGSLVIIE